MPEAQEWWDATRERRLLVQRCRSCGHHQLYPRAVCTACHAMDLEFKPASGRGTVYSFTVVHRSPQPGYEPPYTVAIVQLEEGARLLTNIVGGEVACDQPVAVEWEELSDGRHLPVFRPE
jgi:uncharacterized OB-fold protein